MRQMPPLKGNFKREVSITEAFLFSRNIYNRYSRTVNTNDYIYRRFNMKDFMKALCKAVLLLFLAIIIPIGLGIFIMMAGVAFPIIGLVFLAMIPILAIGIIVGLRQR